MSGISSTLNLSVLPATVIPVTPEYACPATIAKTELGGAQSTTASATLVDIIDISGSSGVFQFVGLLSDSIPLTSSELKITIDGVVVYDETQAMTARFMMSPIGYFMIDSAGSQSSVAFDEFTFRESFKIEAHGGGNTVHVLYKYYLT